ncbi:PDZ domain-containing protein [Streptomyces sp. SID3343]|nr:PDZ domain-containing protein [Streptomyces sp. SID3343]
MERTREAHHPVGPWTILGVGVCVLLPIAFHPVAATASTPAAAHTTLRAPAGLQPQREIPELDAPGEAREVVYDPDHRSRPSQGVFTATAPEHTRILDLDLDCPSCDVDIARDGSTATAWTPPGRWNFVTPVRVLLRADADAPLAGGEYSGTFSLDDDEQPLVVITEGEQGILGLQHEDTPDRSGARVRGVTRESPADRAGIRVGDVVTSFDGKPVTNAADLRAARIGRVRSGAEVPLTYRQQDGTTKTVRVTLD